MAVLSGTKKKDGSSGIAPDVRARLDSYAHGECDYELLAAAIKGLCRASDDSVWEILSILDQYHRRGALPDEVFRSLKAIVSYIALGPPIAATRKPARASRNQRTAAPAKHPEQRQAVKPAMEPPPTQEAAPVIEEPITEEPITNESVAPASGADHVAASGSPPAPASATQPLPAEITVEQFLARASATMLHHELSQDDTEHSPPHSLPESGEKQSTAVPHVAEHQQPSAARRQASTAAAQPRHEQNIERHAAAPGDAATRDDTKVRSATPAAAQREMPSQATAANGEARERNVRQAAAAQSVVPGRVLHDRYAIESALAFGRSTAVFRVRDQFRTHDDRPIAVKVLLLALSKLAPAQFENELRVAQHASHPNIVKVFDLDRDGDLLFYSMELIEGQTLSDLLQYSPPKRPQAMAILTQVANALSYLHERSIVHGDIHPDNILISATGLVKLVDFGAAAEHESSPPWLAVAAGDQPASSLIYASCERLEGLPADKRDDIFSLSCIAYELLGHEHPFRGRLATRARDAQQAPPRIPELAPRQWRSLQYGLAWQRDDRPDSLREWLTGLESSNNVSAPETTMSAESESTLTRDAISTTSIPITPDLRRRVPPMMPHAASQPAAAKRHISSTWYLTIVVGVLAILAFAFMRFDFDAATTPALAQAQASVKQAIDEGIGSLTGENTNSPRKTINTATASASSAAPTSAESVSTVDNVSNGNVTNVDHQAPNVAPTTTSPVETGAAPASSAESAPASSAASVAAQPAAEAKNLAQGTTNQRAAAAPVSLAAAVKSDSAKLDKKADKPNESHGKIGFAQDTFVVSKRDGAARIKLKRDGGTAGKVTFAWWPEPGTAEAGKDFMSLGKKTETLESGEREITVFVPLISGSNNENRHVFFVELSDPSNGLGLGRITRARVVIADE